MALPVVRHLADCAQYNSTVSPYQYQLFVLPYVLVESFNDLAALRQLYLDTNPLIMAFGFALALFPIFLLVSEINKNYSQVDRVWSILPTVYNVHYAAYSHLSGLNTARVDAVAAVTAIWSIRLTYNYFRKGGYSPGSEDYRWAPVKKFTGPAVFFLFNVIFISLVQSILLFGMTTPTYILLLTQRLSTHAPGIPSWTGGDVAAATMMLIFVAISFVADQQQWNYHVAKSQYQRKAKVPAGYELADLDRGFLTKGLFAYSRHPNFAAEQCVWVTLYAWSCLVTRTWYNWSGIGAIMYLFLFQASTWLTELISSGKYPEYKIYQQEVAKFLPIPGSAPPTFPDPSTSYSNGMASKKKDAVKARQRYSLR
ncbi:uncharacterized protein Z518_11082 [Rhinocladiella mackenziei CBS 650.93]|uniref:Rhinocladiella mackenziei CBS 650.93 unplaced genomic scaffold supercont1.11, whole genome shotgun sequence n=1 Tax=Rhinocladiella mackenziei CBS 650.93 TaxID=1442369 RepID=A0A0D2ISD0_9EURO|nr:uncharacterized protein Z518_11082 [Rhinocladiella mackenziei CBS 650.93]KIW99669.1 hypothetical protein Z518_11082 [Rhinocladiella mackenziei CBS 650.93]